MDEASCLAVLISIFEDNKLELQQIGQRFAFSQPTSMILIQAGFAAETLPSERALPV